MWSMKAWPDCLFVLTGLVENRSGHARYADELALFGGDPDFPYLGAASQVLGGGHAGDGTYVSQCFVPLGFGCQEAGMRAFVLYSYMISESLMHGQGTETQRQARREFVESLLLSRG